MDDERTLEQIEADITDVQALIDKINKKEAKGKALSALEIRNRTLYEANLNSLLKEKEDLNKNKVVPAATAATKTVTPAAPVNKGTGTGGGIPAAPVVNKTSTGSKEKLLENVEKKAAETADEMNDEEAKNKKMEDAKSAAETAKDIANQIDANVEENIPTWFWREAQEMSPSDKAKRGFIISNYILNRLGTAAGNIGAIVQNAGGSGGASLKEHGGSYIDQYRKSKLEQAMANRKTKQNTLLEMQGDAAKAYGKSEYEIRTVQNKLRNSKYWNKYNRLTNEQQIYIQGLLYNDTKDEISDAVLGNLIDQIMKGKDVSLEQLATSYLTSYGIGNVDKIVSGVSSFTDKILEKLNWK